jgi:hypothetical protein
MAEAFLTFFCGKRRTGETGTFAAQRTLFPRSDGLRCWGGAGVFRMPPETRDTFVVFLTASFLACTTGTSGPSRSMVLTRVPLSMHATTLLVSIPHLLADELSRDGLLYPLWRYPSRGKSEGEQSKECADDARLKEKSNKITERDIINVSLEEREKEKMFGCNVDTENLQ